MTRKKGLTLLPGVPDLHLIRLEADEPSILAIVATTLSGAHCDLDPLLGSRRREI